MPVLGVDTSHWQGAKLPWRAWYQLQNVRVAICRASIGYMMDDAYPQNLAEAREAGIEMRAAYHAILHHDRETPYFDPVRQCRVFLGLLIPGLTSVSVLDLEADGVTEPMVRAWCDWYDAHSNLPLWLYGNMELAVFLRGNYPRYAKYDTWIADYGYVDLDTDRRSTPPPQVPGKPALPRVPQVGRRKIGWQYAGQNGRLPPYPNAIDLTYYDGTEADVRQLFGVAPASPPMPVITKGPKIGIHAIEPNITLGLVRRARDEGWTWPVVKSVDNAGMLAEVKVISPKTICIYRAVNIAEDSAQDVGTWTQAEMRTHAVAALQFTMGKLVTQAEQRAPDYLEPINEADPPGVSGWRAFGNYLKEMVMQANLRGVKIAIPGLNNGTPEWDEMRAFVETGLFGLMRQGGHILTAHEGVFGSNPIWQGYGDRIPGAPIVAGAGSLAFRYRYLYSLLKARGEVVPLVISEFYSGGNLTPADAMPRFAWYDREARRDDYVLGVLGFTVDPGPNWTGSNYNPLYKSAELWAYIRDEKDYPNATGGETMIDEQTRLALLTKARASKAANDTASASAQAVVDALIALAPPPPPAKWWEAWPAGVIDPPRPLPFPAAPISFYDANGVLLPIPKRQNQMDAFERKGELFRVLRAPINGVLWWVKASDLPAPATV